MVSRHASSMALLVIAALIIESVSVKIMLGGADVTPHGFLAHRPELIASIRLKHKALVVLRVDTR